MIDRTYGHLAPHAENYERELPDEFDAKNEAFGSYRAPKASRGERIVAENSCSIRESRRADSNRGPLHYER